MAYTAPACDALLHVTACCIVSWCVVGPYRVSLWRGVCHVVMWHAPTAVVVVARCHTHTHTPTLQPCACISRRQVTGSVAVCVLWLRRWHTWCLLCAVTAWCLLCAVTATQTVVVCVDGCCLLLLPSSLRLSPRLHAHSLVFCVVCTRMCGRWWRRSRAPCPTTCHSDSLVWLLLLLYAVTVCVAPLSLSLLCTASDVCMCACCVCHCGVALPDVYRATAAVYHSIHVCVSVCVRVGDPAGVAVGV